MNDKKGIRVDYNDRSYEEMMLEREGKITKAEGYEMKKELFRELEEAGIDHCSCPEKCPHHGNCKECVILHRGHRDHLPYCFWDMINERIYHLQLLTEGSLASFKPHGRPADDCGQKEWEESL